MGERWIGLGPFLVGDWWGFVGDMYVSLVGERCARLVGDMFANFVGEIFAILLATNLPTSDVGAGPSMVSSSFSGLSILTTG